MFSALWNQLHSTRWRWVKDGSSTSGQLGSGGASLPEVILLKRLFYWPLIIAFLSVIFSTAVIGGLTFNQFFA